MESHYRRYKSTTDACHSKWMSVPENRQKWLRQKRAGFKSRNAASKKKATAGWKRYTAAEEARIMSDTPIAELAKELGRSLMAIEGKRKKMSRKVKHA